MVSAMRLEVAPGEMITITGQAYCKNMAVKSIEVTTSANGAYRSAYVNKSMAKATATTFTIEFPLWTLNASYWGSGRLISAPIEFVFWSAVNADGNGDGTMGVSGQAISYLQYRINVAPKNIQFERYSQIGGAYQKNDEGSAVMGSLGISISEGRTVSDITVATVNITNNGGEPPVTMNIPTNVLTAALSQNGYIETAPSLFSSVVFDTAYNYTLLFTIGDAYNTYSFSVLVARAFANVHMSGCPTGGVAFGKFSAATEDNPLFECEFPAQFNGGIDAVGKVESSRAALGFQSGYVPAVGTTSSNSYKDIKVTFDHPFAAGLTPIVLTTFFTQSTAGYFGRCCVAAYAVSNTGFTMRFYNGDSSGRNPGFYWLAIGTTENGQE